MGKELVQVKNINEKINVFARDGKQWTTSLNVAEVFGTPHDEVLKRIRNCQCSEGFRLVNFHESNYLNSQNKSMPMYEMTRDGFSFLVMGFTGAKAAQFKEAYIEAFNKAVAFVEKQIDANARHILVYEEFHREQMEAQKEFRSLMSTLVNGVVSIGSDVVGLKNDMAYVKDDVTELKSQMKEVKNLAESNTRIRPYKTSREIHLEFEKRIFKGQCPCCMKTQILDEHGNPIRPGKVFVWDHMRSRHENALDKTWPICASCNTKKSNDQISDRRTETMFAAYQIQLEEWREQSSKQLSIFTVIKNSQQNCKED